MRRIKTYVMIVGVTLSVAPFFNYALAQQGGNSTELLLQVQTMRQEIAELRDMIERQQFQLKRLQQQSDSQSQQFEAARGFGNAAPGQTYQGGFNSPSVQSPAAQPQLTNESQTLASQQATPAAITPLPQAVSGVTTDANNFTANAQAAVTQQQAPVIQQQTPVAQQQAPVIGQQTPVAQQQATVNGQQTLGAVQQQAPVGQQATPTVQQQSAPLGTVRTYPPVVDRSFSTSIPPVPVTGAGSQIPTNQGAQNVLGTQAPTQAPTNGFGTDSDTVYSAAALANTAAQNAVAQVNQTAQPAAAQGANVGVISIPSQAGTVVAQGSQQVTQSSQQIPPVQGLPNQVSQVQPVANQLAVNQAAPGQTSVAAVTQGQAVAGQVAANQVAQPQTQAVLSEDDYYGQGFELLKQSKYEEAASIFEQQLSAYPRGDLADDAHYWIAEAMHVSRKLDVAKVHLRAIISDYPQSRRLPDAMLKTAYIEQSQGNQIEARILFQEIVNLHPQSDAAIAAKNQLAAVN